MDDERERERGREIERESRTMNARYLLRQFKNTANYLRLLFDPDLYSLCKSYPVISFAISSRNLITERIFRVHETTNTVYIIIKILFRTYQFQFPFPT